jgi:DNA polymerase III alpha subunit
MKLHGGMKTNKYGQVILSSDNLRELLLHGKNISHTNVEFDEDIELFKKYQDQLLQTDIIFEPPPEESLSFEEFQLERSDDWIFPTEFQHVDVLDFLLKKCKNDLEKERVNREFIMYEKRGLIMLLRLFIFLVNHMRSNKYVWGVGRGSSVCSYILYLIGIHRVDSLKYGLEIEDYLKD